MFGWFRNRKQIQAVESSADALVKWQFTISDEEPAEHVDDSWALGYVFGALTAVLQRIGLEPGPEARPLLERGFDIVYGLEGPRTLQIAFSRTSDPDFAEAQLVGASELLAFAPGSPPPFGLGAYLGSGKGLGGESQPGVRKRLRQRAMERMTPAAFSRAFGEVTGTHLN